VRSLTRTESRSGAARDPPRPRQQRRRSGERATARKVAQGPPAKRGRDQMETWEIEHPEGSTSKGATSMQDE
jgi:hypothetical protein